MSGRKTEREIPKAQRGEAEQGMALGIWKDLKEDLHLFQAELTDFKTAKPSRAG